MSTVNVDGEQQPAASLDTVAASGIEKLRPSEASEVEAETSTLRKPAVLSSNPQGATNPPSSTSALAAKALKFASEATPATIGGVLVAGAAILYAILGKIGLLLIGALGGVLVFISFEVKNPSIAQAVSREGGSGVLDRIWTELSNTKEEESTQDEAEAEAAFKLFDDFRPETRDALGGLVDAVIRDYVKWWYSPIVPSDHSFPLACRKTLTSYLLAISNRISRKRPADAFLDLLMNSSSILIALLSELAAAFADLPPDSNMNAADAVYNYLASNPDSRLASLLNQRQQVAKFRMVAEDLLSFLDQGSQNCDPARIFLREILANSVLESTLQTCSKAEWINGWIVYLLEAGEPDLNQAIDVGMQTGRDTGPPVFADIEGNVGNIGVAKPSAARSSTEAERSRRKESLGHKKKLSRADEELEEAMEEMKRMNALIAHSGEPNHHSGPNPTNAANGGSESSSNQKSEATEDSVTDRSSTRETSSDGFFPKNPDFENPPWTPRSTTGVASQPVSPHQFGSQQQHQQQQFTTFEQIVPNGQADEMEDEDGPRKAPLTLHNASFTLHDDSSGDNGKMRAKPHGDYLIQVEPSSAAHTGWMIVRRYADFETLHEILRRIATISGATAFTELHKELPSWKIHTRESLRGELERYLRDACWYQSLAESEGMKRFLEKSQGHSHSNAKSFGWESVGKNMLDVLTTAPKGAMGGGKTLVGGVSGVFGNIAGLSRKSTSGQSVELSPSAKRLSISTPPPPRKDSVRSPARSERASMDSQRSSVISTQPSKMAPMSRRPSAQSQGEPDGEAARTGRSADRAEAESSPAASTRPSREHSRASSVVAMRSPSTLSLDFTKLPAPPDEMPSDYESSVNGDETAQSRRDDKDKHPYQYQYQTIRARPSSASSASPLNGITGAAATTASKKQRAPAKPGRQYTAMTEQETRVAVELLFAIINEMYTLSSAWNIRRTLLAAAKSFLLRPGNPSLLTVQSLIQSSVLDANTSDAGIAAQLRKLRENTMPTDQERSSWPPDLTTDDKEKLAVKARKLLIRSGVPAALMGVMGQAATGEALGRVFDCLQIEEVARGLIFGLMLQAVRILTH